MIPEGRLRISAALTNRIKAWFNAYFSLRRPDWPLWTAPDGSTSAEEEELWVAEGESIRVLLEQELGEPVALVT
jgi:hypothetical protein